MENSARVMTNLAVRGRGQWTRSIAGAAEPIRRTLHKLGPALIGLGALQISSLLDQLIAGYPVIVGDTIALPGDTAYLRLEGGPLRDSESIVRSTHKDFKLPAIMTAPWPCCTSDPLFHEARLLARRYGIEEAEGEPGFEEIVDDVAGYL